MRQHKVCTLNIFSWNHFLGFKEAKMTLHHPSPTSGPHLFWSLAARDFLVDAGVGVPCSIRWNSPSCSWFPASFLPNRFSNHGSGWSNANISGYIPKQIQNTNFYVCSFSIYIYSQALNKNHAQEPIDLRWCGPIYDCRLPRENPHNHLADLRASRLNRFDGPMARCAGAPVWNRDTKRWYASLETWWEVTREWRKTEMWRVIILSVTEKVTEISASKCLICWSRSFRQVGFLASFWRSWFFYLSQWPSEPPSGHTSLRPAQVEPATLAANGNLPRGTTSFCKLASGKLT